MIWVKICGIANLDDAAAAIEAGADAIGFVFAPSPRRISPRDAARVIGVVPDKVEKIGVFVNQQYDIILKTVAEAGLTGVQLHGEEDGQFIEELRNESKLPIRVVKSITVREGFESGFSEFEDHGRPDVFLLDSGGAAARGGTGKRFDWRSSAPLVRLAARRHHIIIAGGLTPDNVAEAVKQFRPYGVDVASGVELEPGKKDHDKVRQFISATRKADSDLIRAV
ncbi:MAG: phosphoribosylanthranilate isomerase [Acidobacteria bacterium]|nr:phosphoribosylanthranilate isomerase [Acidobacteriota bacterium]